MSLNKKNDLSARMKRYEASYNIQLPPRGYVIIRLDGKGFSKYTKSLTKPFDSVFSDIMDAVTEDLCKYFNPKLAYTQSDEISLVLTDFETEETQGIFDGKIQKIASISASMVTAKFNQLVINNAYEELKSTNERHERYSELEKIIEEGSRLAYFDSRVFLIPDYREVYNYLVWRQKDCERNSVSMAHHAAFGHKKGIKKNSSQKQDDLMLNANINWNDCPVKFKRGVIISKKNYIKTVDIPEKGLISVERSRWETDYNTPIFTKSPEYLYKLIPIMGEKV